MKSGYKKKLKKLYYQNRGWIDIWKEISYWKNKNKIEFKPVFIIGCGRSGTTILGNTLAEHKQICYLNERRDLWHKIYPEFDIWSGKYEKPILVATEKNYTQQQAKKIRRLFVREQIAAKGKILLEKLPINNFRLDFIKAAFPDAKYIYLHRNGLEVAESISKKVSEGWFGVNNIKWNLLHAYGRGQQLEFTDEKLKKDFHKGIYEWRLSMKQSDNFFKRLAKDKFISLSYKDLIEKPNEIIQNIYTFLDLKTDDNFVEQLSNVFERKNKTILRSDDPVTFEIGGDLLVQSIENNYSV